MLWEKKWESQDVLPTSRARERGDMLSRVVGHESERGYSARKESPRNQKGKRPFLKKRKGEKRRRAEFITRERKEEKGPHGLTARSASAEGRGTE